MAYVRLDQIAAAAELIRPVIRHTPVESFRPLAERLGGPAYLKCENIQRTGSFKIRGAYTRISHLTDQERQAGVVAASAGNHAQGVAFAAQLLGTQATVFMPVGASISKLAATKAYGAQVFQHGQTLQDAIERGQEYADAKGAVFISPFDHIDVLAGQGTVGLEIMEQVPEVKTVVVALGGGGLLGGIAAAIKQTDPSIRVVGVQAEAAAAWPGSLAAGRPVPAPSMATFADGIAVNCPSDLTYEHVAGLVDEVATVSEEQLSQTILLLAERAKQVVEASGAASVAAVLADPDRYPPPVVAVLSGGNIDPLLLSNVINHGLVAAGRYLTLSVEISDRPGSLAQFLGLIAEAGASVVDLEQSRLGAGLGLGNVEVGLSLECRSHDHQRAIIAAISAAGHRIRSRSDQHRS